MWHRFKCLMRNVGLRFNIAAFNVYCRLYFFICSFNSNWFFFPPNFPFLTMDWNCPFSYNLPAVQITTYCNKWTLKHLKGGCFETYSYCLLSRVIHILFTETENTYSTWQFFFHYFLFLTLSYRRGTTEIQIINPNDNTNTAPHEVCAMKPSGIEPIVTTVETSCSYALNHSENTSKGKQ